ncbi:MAG TPA: OB-fold domain-containing protein [Bryobacteraceae bacterium]|nr:OB-fold domain-containing protein [Bryobacteraceae bacterium]
MTGTIYTETTIYAAAREFVNDAPYQLVIVTLGDGKRVTGRVEGERVSIDDGVEHAGDRGGVPFFRKL